MESATELRKTITFLVFQSILEAALNCFQFIREIFELFLQILNVTSEPIVFGGGVAGRGVLADLVDGKLGSVAIPAFIRERRAIV